MFDKDFLPGNSFCALAYDEYQQKEQKMESNKRDCSDSAFWDNMFEGATVHFRKKLPAKNEFDDMLNAWHGKLSSKEEAILKKYMTLSEIEKSSNYFADKIFPMSYLNFLRFCDIDEMENGNRYFQFLSLEEVREYTIAYIFPKWLNGGVAFAMNGSGVHYVFDMRKESIFGEYPIYAVSSGNLGWDNDQAFFLGNSFMEVITATTNVEDIYELVCF